MDVAVVGLWHLGLVTAACLASRGHRVLAYDPDSRVVRNLNAGRLPISEPGLEDLVGKGVADGQLGFTEEPQSLGKCQVVWIAFDTPVDDDDQADVELVICHVIDLFPHIGNSATVLVSSQLPVGSVARLEQAYRQACPGGTARFACSPENLRLGKAIEVFTNADRFVVGVRSLEDRDRIQHLLGDFTSRFEWMSVESAEMTKHAINAFLALEVTYANELAALCSRAGADARDVARGLMSDQRIGPKAYLKPGPPFAGGTLARDVAYLNALSQRTGQPAHLLPAIVQSNNQHKLWAISQLSCLVGDLGGKKIALLGLTYKAGTDTLRRSTAIELCRALVSRGSVVRGYDPLVRQLPDDLASVELCHGVEAAVRGAAAIVVATDCSEFRGLTLDVLWNWSGGQPWVIDPSSILTSSGQTAATKHVQVGRAA